MMIERAQALIDLSALKHNFQVIKTLAPQQSIMAMIKANGYGHGLIRIGSALSQADAFGVACLEEALSLRAAGITQPIAIMAGFSNPQELKIISENQFEPVIHHITQLETLKNTSIKKPIKIWLKIDTGMHRLGFAPKDVDTVYQQLMANEKISKPIRLMTHFADADDPIKPTTLKQIAEFNKITAQLSGAKSIANSAGIIAWPQSHADWVRPGIILYGASPMRDNKAINLKPVMTLQAKIIAINNLQRGDAVAYGGTWTCPENMPVGVVSIGYGDGYPRHAKNGTPVLVNNVRCNLVGRVSMDMITVDLRACPQANVGDVVTLWGNGLPAEEIAPRADTIPYTLFCGVTQRVKMVEK